MSSATTSTNLKLEKHSGKEYVVMLQVIEWSSGKKQSSSIILTPEKFEEMISYYLSIQSAKEQESDRT
jgi:hypothetical protein